jgi:phage baseplate assembly protein W
MAEIERDRAILRRRLLGFGLRCAPTQGAADLGRDLVLSPGADGATRDFAVIEGIDNLGQALTVALTTPLTGDVFNVDFGFDGLNALAEETVPIMTQERIRVAVITLLQKDPRVRRIVDVKLQDGRLTNPGASIRELDVKAVFETVTGDTATLDLGKVVPNG